MSGWALCHSGVIPDVRMDMEECGGAKEDNIWIILRRFLFSIRQLNRGKRYTIGIVYGGSEELLTSTEDVVRCQRYEAFLQ